MQCNMSKTPINIQKHRLILREPVIIFYSKSFLIKWLFSIRLIISAVKLALKQWSFGLRRQRSCNLYALRPCIVTTLCIETNLGEIPHRLNYSLRNFNDQFSRYGQLLMEISGWTAYVGDLKMQIFWKRSRKT